MGAQRILRQGVQTLSTGCEPWYTPTGAAEQAARKAVKARLKCPGSGESEVSEIAARAEDDRLYIVYLAVDSQNAYGAVPRSPALVLVLAGETIGDDSPVLHLELSEKSQSIGRIKELTREMGQVRAVRHRGRDATSVTPMSSF